MPLTGMKIALTGKIDGVSRSDFKKLIADNNGEYVASLDESVDILVVGERPLASKVEQAEQLEVETLDWEAFQGRLVEKEDPEVPLAFEAVEDAPPSLIRVDDRKLRVLDVAIAVRPKPGQLTPPLELFAHYTLDAPTLRMLRFIARAVELHQPCLLEGDTATSKTSAISYLAAITNHEVVRINLNGQTDTSELVGRFVPNEDGARLPVEELLDHLDLLEDETRHILERARDEGRSLTGVEVQQIAANEQITPPAWRFHEGLVPKAMRKGWWVILDEVNLAEPQVLERLNSVLERDPTLVLTEGPGTRFGVNGDVKVHPDFRIFATMNPAEYQGRSILSPAYKDRWVATWQAEPPGELEYRQMLERLVFGRQPDIEADGLFFTGDNDAGAPYGQLAATPGVGEFLGRLAALHAALVTMATPAEGKPATLGVSRRERYVFSRRGLLAILDGLAVAKLCDPVTNNEITFTDSPEALAADAIERAYLDRIRGEADRTRVMNLLRSLGLSRGNWLHRFEAAAEAPAD